MPVQAAVRQHRKAVESHLLHHLALVDPNVVGAPGSAFRCATSSRFLGMSQMHIGHVEHSRQPCRRASAYNAWDWPSGDDTTWDSVAACNMMFSSTVQTCLNWA